MSFLQVWVSMIDHGGTMYGALLRALDGVLLAASVGGVLRAASVGGVLLAASVGLTLSPSASVVVLLKSDFLAYFC
jgi:hypothetical protein